ncbi:SCO family protein [Jatrophihabitans telluris]|uniref:SCO family protein n=1 Tax=Jatrophihabitans telluris TaxID=2038343 RepID=A0ABY4QVY9_9ACTN|nr:SCO family protein [Jatrophihabitans telluris]UQX87655.1 SCO family protein [Jatrophihabitans telluris]
MRVGRLLAAAIGAGALLLVAGCSSSSGGKPASTVASELNDHTNPTYQGVGLDPAQPRPQFTLTDTAGKQFKFGQQTAGKPTLLYFGYTHCPDICPTTMADIAGALAQVPTPIRNRTQVVFVTTDVKNDTGPAIRKWLDHFDSDVPNRFIGLYGTQTQIDTAQVAAHVTLAEGDGKQHSAQVLLYGSDDYARVAFLQSNNQSGQIAHDLQVVAAQK